jgi:hypothetical protein
VPNWSWAKKSGGVNNEGGNSVATDASGNVYVGGFFERPTVAFGSFTLVNGESGAGKNYFLCK